MPFETHELDAVKASVSTALADNHREFGLAANQAQALGLVLLAAIDAGASDPIDPRPFAVGRRVQVKASTMQGAVVRTAENAGEVHTVVVRLDDLPGEHPFGPRELEVLA